MTFFKNIHDNELNEQSLSELRTLFVLKKRSEVNNLMESLKLLIKEKVIFMGETDLEIDHVKDDKANWVTKIYKISNFKLSNNDSDSDDNEEKENNDDDNSDNDDSDDDTEYNIEIAKLNYVSNNDY